MSRQKWLESGLNLISRQVQNVEKYKGKLIMNYKGKTAAIMVKYRTGGQSGTWVTKNKYTGHLKSLFKFTQELQE